MTCQYDVTQVAGCVKQPHSASDGLIGPICTIPVTKFLGVPNGNLGNLSDPTDLCAVATFLFLVQSVIAELA